MIRKLFVIVILAGLGFVFYTLFQNFDGNTGLNKTAGYYAQNGPSEVGAANLVTAVVVTYRGLDTLGEVTVLFISAAGASLLLRRRRSSAEKKSRLYAESSEIVQTTLSILFPIILLFGVYIFINGHLTPGGGFQGGAVIASALLFFILARPNDSISHALLMKVESLSGFTYVMLGLLGVFLAGGFLDNRVLPGIDG